MAFGQPQTTLIFEPKSGFLPSATEFGVSVKRGCVSLSGRRIEGITSWKFETVRPNPDQVRGDPEGGSYVGLPFHCNVKVESVLAKTHMVIKGSPVPLRVAKGDEYKRHCSVNASYPCYVVLVPERTQPAGLDGRVTVESGIEATEGPLRSVTGSTYAIHTQPPERSPLQISAYTTNLRPVSTGS